MQVECPSFLLMASLCYNPQATLQSVVFCCAFSQRPAVKFVLTV